MTRRRDRRTAVLSSSDDDDDDDDYSDEGFRNPALSGSDFYNGSNALSLRDSHGRSSNTRDVSIDLRAPQPNSSSTIGYAMQLAAMREEDHRLVDEALEKIQYARSRGKDKVRLSQRELDALERDRTRESQPAASFPMMPMPMSNPLFGAGHPPDRFMQSQQPFPSVPLPSPQFPSVSRHQQSSSSPALHRHQHTPAAPFTPYYPHSSHQSTGWIGHSHMDKHARPSSSDTRHHSSNDHSHPVRPHSHNAVGSIAAPPSTAPPTDPSAVPRFRRKGKS